MENGNRNESYAVAGLKPVSRKKAPLTPQEILRKKEIAFFNGFQVTANHISISGANSWRSTTINGVYKPEIGKISPSFVKVNNPNVCLIYYGFVWYLKYGSRTMCKLVCHQPEMHCMPYEIYTQAVKSIKIGTTTSSDNVSATVPPVSDPDLLLEAADSQNHMAAFNVGSGSIISNYSSNTSVLVPPAITGVWQEKFGMFLPIYRERRQIQCGVVNSPYFDDTMSRNESTADSRRSISIASYSFSGPGRFGSERQSLMGRGSMYGTGGAGGTGGGGHEQDSYDYSALISFRDTAADAGLTDVLHLRFAIIVIALLELDLFYRRKCNVKNKPPPTAITSSQSRVSEQSFEATTNEQAVPLTTEEIRVEVERIKKIYRGLLCTVKDPDSDSQRTNALPISSPQKGQSNDISIPSPNNGGGSGGRTMSTVSFAGGRTASCNASSVATVSWMADKCSSSSSSSLPVPSSGVKSGSVIIDSSANFDKNNFPVRDTSYKLIDVTKYGTKQEICNALQFLIIDADTYFSDLTTSFVEATKRVIDGSSDDPNTTSELREMMASCNDTLNELKETLKLILFSDVSLKANLIQWTAAVDVGEQYSDSSSDSDSDSDNESSDDGEDEEDDDGGDVFA